MQVYVPCYGKLAGTISDVFEASLLGSSATLGLPPTPFACIPIGRLAVLIGWRSIASAAAAGPLPGIPRLTHMPSISQSTLQHGCYCDVACNVAAA